VKNPVCVHFHIFKNAGTTLEWILKNNFSKNAISIDSDNPKDMLHFDKIAEILEKKPKTRSLSSHQFRFPVFNNERFEFISIVFLRHPIDRAISIYHFQKKRTDADRPGIVKAKELDLNGYIKWNLKTKSHRAMRNFQVLYLSDKPVESVVDENDFKIAVQRIKEIKIIGVVDKFDESLVLAEEVLKEYFPTIDLSYIRQNVSEDRKGTLMEKLEKAKNEIDEQVWKKLLEQNKFDLELYEKANEELNTRLEKIENFDSKMSNFKNRCKKINYSQKMRNFLKR